MRWQCRPIILVHALALLLGGLAGPAQASPRKLYHVVRRPEGGRYSAVITMKIGPFDIGATQDREVCQYVEVPYDERLADCVPGDAPGDPERCGLTIVGTDIEMKGTGASHHFILWAYEGSAEGAALFPAGVHDSKACLDFGPADSINTRQVTGSQMPRLRAFLPRGIGQQVAAVTADSQPKGIGFILNSHYIGTGTPSTGFVKVKVFVAARHTIRAHAKLIFDVLAGAFIEVPPGETRTVSSNWEVGGPVLPIVGGPPTTDACVIFVTGHMHKRGLRFTTDLVDENGSRRIYQASDYSDMRAYTFPTPQLMRRGSSFHYECTHDNGVTTPVKMGCELEAGVTPGIAQWKAFVKGSLDGSPHACASDADCTGVGTGRCVPANLVFGFTSNDDMCILPGVYYDAVPGAPPGRECDVSLLPRN
jgi:hypothetical protein